jgi:transglutaminase-like putative cysteine protease
MTSTLTRPPAPAPNAGSPSSRRLRRDDRADARSVELASWPRRAVSAVAAVATVAIAAQQFERVFGGARTATEPLVAAIAVGAVLLAVSGLHIAVRLLATGTAVAGVTAWAVQSAGGTLPDDLRRAVVSGVGDAMAANWPVPPLASSLGAFACIAGLASAIAVELAVQRRSTSSILPSLAVVGLVALLSAPGGDPPMWSVGAYCVALVVLLRSISIHEIAGTARVYLGLAAVASIAVPALVGAALSDDRYDPRDAREASPVVSESVTPLARLDEWRSISPPVAMFETTASEPARWRLVALTRYDGRTWLPADDYRIAGSTIDDPIDGVATTEIDVTIGELDSLWLPFVDRTVSVSESVSVDGTRGGILAAQPPAAGDEYQVRAQLQVVQAAQLVGASAGDADAPFAGGFAVPSAVAELASVVTVGARTDFERATLLAEHLATEFVLDPTTPPGHSIAEIEVFLTRTRSGSDEQFVAAYGLLAASIGLPVRVAVGFETTAASTDAGTDAGTVAMSSAASAWPEIEFEEYGWVRFDPVPTTVNSIDPSLGEGGIAPTDDVIPPPPTTTPPVPDADEQEEQLAEVSETEAGAPSAVVVPLAVGGILLVLLGTYVLVVLGLKRMRRRRRLAQQSPSSRAVGAFATGVDHIIDLGGEAPRWMTNDELVSRAVPELERSAPLLRPVAEIATAAVFAGSEAHERTADRAWERLESFERGVVLEAGRWRRFKASVSTRSLRRPLSRDV